MTDARFKPTELAHDIALAALGKECTGIEIECNDDQFCTVWAMQGDARLFKMGPIDLSGANVLRITDVKIQVTIEPE